MTQRDDDQPRDPADEVTGGEPVDEEGTGAERGSSGPAPATWAGRRRSGSEDAGEHDQLPAEEPEEEPAASDEPPEDRGEEEADEPDLVEASEEPEAEVDAEETGNAEEEAPEGEEGGEEAAGGDTAERLSRDTVEANTLALGDREAAREAAMQGLRARAAQSASKPGTEAITAPPPKTPAPEALADGEQPPAPAPPAPPAAVTAADEAEDQPPKRGLWARFAAGSLLIVVAMATSTALSLLFFLNGVLADFHGLNSVRNELTVANPGDPQTILILGSDKRPGEGKAIGARSDTTILLRVASDQITVLSIPRDLKVNIPGHGIDKFNAAYTVGGPKLTVKVVKQLTGITDINHVVNVNFTGFADAVNAIGCVYVDVDHHYYHSNLGLAASEQYAEIDIPAGYQRMCGYNALQYVRYRHDDNDLVRSARQQEFLREMRQELPASRILSDYNELVGILKKYVTLDIRREVDLITLAKLILSANNAPVVQVHFPANLGGPTASYVTASEAAIKEAVAKFEGTTPTPTPDDSSGGSDSGGGGSGSGGGSDSGGSSSEPAAPPPLIDATTTAQERAATLAAAKTKSGKPMLDFPVYYPTKLAPDSIITEDSRAFPIDGPGDEEYRGYKIVVSMPTDGYTGYYGVSGTDWKEPPILEHPDETRTLDGREYLLSWDGPQLRLIGWKTDSGSYWVDNTLTNVLSPGQMFGIAESMQKYTG